MLVDRFKRNHSYLRLSITDRCNLNCIYCNPKNGLKINSSVSKLLSFEEIRRITEIFVRDFGFSKIRLTGGEPFARKNVSELISVLSGLKKSNPFELSATSNAVLLKGKISELHRCGIDRFNFSLDTLRRERYYQMCAADDFDIAFESILEALQVMPGKVKINTVVIKGFNDDELVDFTEFAVKYSIPVRFIEYMPFSDNFYDKSRLISYKEMIGRISEKYRLIPLDRNRESVGKDYSIEGHDGMISFIASLSEHFCSDCNRLRLSSDGKLKLCLFSRKDSDLDLKNMIRMDLTDNEISEAIREFILGKNSMHEPLDKLIMLKNSSMISVGG